MPFFRPSFQPSSLSLSVPSRDRKLELTVTVMTVVWSMLVVVFASGCNRAVLIPEPSPIRVGPNCETKIYTLIDGEWIISSNTVIIPEGWYCVPPSYVEIPEEPLSESEEPDGQ